ncbi:MAG TPA: efflux RND transporter periplasmic adaptor subunit [Bacteroidia bacterium]|nr:efflux RND transporter periplasmic adaptor subunit [Bacteroidia bacterium]
MRRSLLCLNRKFIGAAVVFATGLSACHKPTPTEAPRSTKIILTAELNKEIKLDTAILSNVNSDITLFAKISADQDQVSNIYPLSSGIVLKVDAMLGDYVKEGQVLATMRSSDVNDFQNQYNQAISNLHLAQKNAYVADELFKTHVMSEKDLLSAKSDLKKAESDSSRVRQLFAIYGARVDNQVPEYKVVSPIEGYVISKNISPNMAVRTDNGTNLFTVSPLKTVWVLADAYESDLSKIQTGQVVNVVTVAYPDTVFKGTIQQISSIIDPITKTLKLRVVLDNKNGQLKPEMFAHVKIRYVEQKKLVHIPSDAVVFEGSKHFAMVYHSRENIETREVDVYKENSGTTYILRGVKEGETVVSKYAGLVYSAFNSKN